MKVTRKDVGTARIETLLWLVGIYCVGVFIYMQYNAAQATQEALDKFGNNTDFVHRNVNNNETEQVNASLKVESFEHYLADFTPDKTQWSKARLEAYAKLEKDDTQLDSIGLLNIPTLNIQAAVFSSSSDEALDLGVGRVKGTSYFGLPGNVAVAGHRDGFFRNLKDIAKGDEIVIRYQYGKDIYRVDAIQIVEPTDVSILLDTEQSTITLITCYPFDFIGSAPQRFIVKASKVKRTLNNENETNLIHYKFKERQ